MISYTYDTLKIIEITKIKLYIKLIYQYEHWNSFIKANFQNHFDYIKTGVQTMCAWRPASMSTHGQPPHTLSALFCNLYVFSVTSVVLCWLTPITHSALFANILTLINRNITSDSTFNYAVLWLFRPGQKQAAISQIETQVQSTITVPNPHVCRPAVSASI